MVPTVRAVETVSSAQIVDGKSLQPEAEIQEPVNTAAIRILPEMLDSLRRFLPDDLYELLERRPNEIHLTAVRDHLSALLRTTKTYLPWPVVMSPQPAGDTGGRVWYRERSCCPICPVLRPCRSA